MMVILYPATDLSYSFGEKLEESLKDSQVTWSDCCDAMECFSFVLLLVSWGTETMQD